MWGEGFRQKQSFREGLWVGSRGPWVSVWEMRARAS
jgi:hypothetical protein